MSDPRTRLRDKLCRELAQAERDARLHPRREARRLADGDAAQALTAIADHADGIEPVLLKLLGRASIGVKVAHAVASVFSGVRHLLVDRMIGRERSYRMTLLGIKHGVDVARMLREVAMLNHDVALLKFCDLFLVERLCLLEDAEQAFLWFAENPDIALGHGARRTGRLALPSPSEATA
ncbi:MAG: hypothetical protein ABI678_32080 [Kofleriaceae bacterium]